MQPLPHDEGIRQLPPGIPSWPAVPAVEVAVNGTIFVVERCHDNSVRGTLGAADPEYDERPPDQSVGRTLQLSDGAALDPQGNLWVTDARGGNGKGHQVIVRSRRTRTHAAGKSRREWRRF